MARWANGVCSEANPCRGDNTQRFFYRDAGGASIGLAGRRRPRPRTSNVRVARSCSLLKGDSACRNGDTASVALRGAGVGVLSIAAAARFGWAGDRR